MSCQRLLRQMTGVLLGALFLTGCGARATTVAPASKIPAATETEPARASPATTSTARDAQLSFGLPAPIYVLSDQNGLAQVWRLTVDGDFSPLTNVPAGVSAFEIAPDGRVVYLTRDGEIWIAGSAGEEPQMPDLPGGAVRAFDVGSSGRLVYVGGDGTLRAAGLTGSSPLMLAEHLPSGAEISGLAISPDGARVAYVVRTPDATCTPPGFPEVDGIWVVDLTGGAPRQLTRSYCRVTEAGGTLPIAFRSAPIWSPDNSRLLVSASASEGSYYGVLDLAEGVLRYPSPTALLSGSVVWSRDGQAILGTDSRFLAPANLLLVDAATLDVTLLLDGQARGRVTVEHHQQTDGRIAFWMAEFDSDDPAGLTYDLYLGTLSGGVFTYEQAVATGWSRPWNVVWSTDESAAAVEIHRGVNGEPASRVGLVSLAGQVTVLEASWSPRWGSLQEDESP